MNTLNTKPLKRLLPLFFLIFIDTIGYFLVIPVIIRLFMPGPDALLSSTTAMNTRNLLYSITLMLSPLAFIICSPLIGYLSDRYGRKKALSYALIGGVIGLALPIIGIELKKISWVLIGRFIAGASSSSQPVAQAGVADVTTDKIRAFSLSLIGFAMTLGMVIGPLCGSYLSDRHLVSWFNTTTPYWFALILSVINIIMIIVLYHDEDQEKLTPTLKTSKNILKQNKIAWLLLCFFCLELSWSQYYQASFLTLTQHFHYSLNQMSAFAAYAGFWMCVGLTVIYKLLIKKYSIETIAYSSLLVASIALLTCLIPHVTWQWIAIVPATIAIGTGYPSLLSMISSRAEIHHQGYVLGCASTLLGIAWMLTGLLSGPLSMHGFDWPIVVSAFAMLIGYIVYYRTHRCTLRIHQSHHK